MWDSCGCQATVGAVVRENEGGHGTFDARSSSRPGRSRASPPLSRRHRPVTDTASQGARPAALAAYPRSGHGRDVAAAGARRPGTSARPDRHQSGDGRRQGQGQAHAATGTEAIRRTRIYSRRGKVSPIVMPDNNI